MFDDAENPQPPADKLQEPQVSLICSLKGEMTISYDQSIYSSVMY